MTSVGGDQRLEALKRLGLNEGATQDEIKSQFRKLALRYHPDMQISADATRSAEAEFKSIAAAYSKLCGAQAGQAGPGPGPGATTAYSRSVRQGASISNNFIAALLVIPLGLIGIRIGLAMREQDLKEKTGRINGLLHPPVNEWIADDSTGGRGGAAGLTGSGLLSQKTTLQPGDGRRIVQRGVADRIMGRFLGTWGSIPPPGGSQSAGGAPAPPP